MNGDEANFTTPPEDFEIVEIDPNTYLTDEERSWPVVELIQEEDFAIEELPPLLDDIPEKIASRSDAIEMAAVLLKDTPMSSQLAESALRELAKHFGTWPEDGMYSHPDSPMNRLVRDMHRSRWGELLKKVILNLYHERSAEGRVAVGGLYGYLADYAGDKRGSEFKLWVKERVDQLCQTQRQEAVAVALSLWPTANYGFLDDKGLVSRLVGRLLDLLGDGSAVAHAAGDLLFYLQDKLKAEPFQRLGVWKPTPAEVTRLIEFLNMPGMEPEGAGRFALGVVVAHPQGVDLAPIVQRLRDGDFVLRECLKWATGWREDEKTLGEVIACLLRGEGLKTVRSLPVSGDDQERVRLSRDKDGIQPWLSDSSQTDLVASDQMIFQDPGKARVSHSVPNRSRN